MKLTGLALPISGTQVVSAHCYGRSLWGKMAKIIARLPDGKIEIYFLKVISFRARVPSRSRDGLKLMNRAL